MRRNHVDKDFHRGMTRGQPPDDAPIRREAGSAEPWTPHGQTYRRGENFGQGGYGAYGAESPAEADPSHSDAHARPDVDYDRLSPGRTEDATRRQARSISTGEAVSRPGPPIAPMDEQSDEVAQEAAIDDQAVGDQAVGDETGSGVVQAGSDPDVGLDTASDANSRDRRRRGDITARRERISRIQSHWQSEAMSAGEIMTSRPKCASATMSVRDVAAIMKEENCGIVPIVDDAQRLVGVITDRDIVVRVCAEGRPLGQTSVGEVMTRDVAAVTPDEDVRDVIALMGKRQIRRVAVVDGDENVIGVVAMADIANRADYDDELEDALEKISARQSTWSRIWR